ncbi:MAG TPA: PhzF family phenazine biosynthesis protein [Gemmataceae bacterium]|nr:PhzF family phenazine biosynthesis protein [Gemmataceae bacterium]
MSTLLHVVDAFTATPFSGNPAAVCRLPAPRSATWMQLVAREMNLSETAFVHPIAGGWSLRWFTPTTEIALCGHATLASAHALCETGALPANEPARFSNKSGWLTCRREGAWIEMDFPALQVKAATVPAELLAGLTITPSFVGFTGCRWLVEVSSEQMVRAAT